MSKTIFAAILLLSASFANASAGIEGSFVSHGVFLAKDSSLVAQPSCGSVNGVEGVPVVAVSPAESVRLLGVAGDATASEFRYFAETGFVQNGRPAWKIHAQAVSLPAATAPHTKMNALAHVYCSFAAGRAS